MTNHRTRQDHETPADLGPAGIGEAWTTEDLGVARALDGLGAAARALPDAGFEPRLLASVQAPTPGAIAPSRPAGAGWRGLRLAAAVALLASVGAAWLALRTPGPAGRAPTVANASQIERDIDIILSWDSDSIDTIDSLVAETLRVDDLLETAWAPLGDDPDSSGSASKGGAM